MDNNTNRKEVPKSKDAINKMKYEISNGVGVNLKQGYNGDISSKDAGKVGGNITKRLIQMAEERLKKGQ